MADKSYWASPGYDNVFDALIPPADNQPIEKSTLPGTAGVGGGGATSPTAKSGKKAKKSVETEALDRLLSKCVKKTTKAGAGTMTGGGPKPADRSRTGGSSKRGMSGVSESHAGQKFSEKKPATHEEKQSTRGAVSSMAHGAAEKVKQVASQVGAGLKQRRPAMAGAKSIECPHCNEGISKGYAIQALAILAKSEGIDIGEELEALAGLSEEAEVDGNEAEKAVSGKRNPVGNKEASNRGKAPGSFTSSARGKGTGESVQRTNKPTNPVTEGGMKKSLNLPIVIGDAQLVQYRDGGDEVLAKSIEDDVLGEEAHRNLRMEHELATGEHTE